MRIAKRRWAGVAFASTLAIALLSACSQAPAPAPTPSATADAPVFASDEEALAAAKDAYAAYLSIIDSVLARDGSASRPISDVATADALAAEEKTAESYAARGYRSVGNSKFDSLRLQSIETMNGSAKLTAYVCSDVSDVDVVDATGASVVPLDRLDRYPLQVIFESHKYDSAHLLISSSETWTGTNFC